MSEKGCLVIYSAKLKLRRNRPLEVLKANYDLKLDPSKTAMPETFRG